MKAKLTIHFDSLWHAGSGQAAGRDVDALFERDTDGLPCLGGRRLRGLIKHAARLHGSHGLVTPQEAFGEDEGDGRSKSTTGLDVSVEASSSGIIRVGSAVIPSATRLELLNRRFELGGLAKDIASTAMENGRAKEHSLRRIEFAIPMDLEAELSWNAPEDKEQQVFVWLKSVLRLVRRAGLGRHDGFGRCRVEISKREETAPPTARTENRTSATSRTLVFGLTLKDGVVVTARGGSAGLHECLDYIPGSALWGVAAARLYGKWAADSDSEAGWKKILSAFHSGKVRFHCARPASPISGSALLPVPLAWHFLKGESFADHDELIPDQLTSCAVKPWKFDHGQPEQVRRGWFSDTGEFRQLEHRHHPKTAMDRDNFDRAEDKKYFGYMALQPGERFIACIEADDDAEGWDELRELFEDGGEIELGRSKAAEFGRAVVSNADQNAWRFPAPTVSPSLGQVVFHALSDLALADKYGQPTLTPSPQTFGLAPGDYSPDPEHTFLQVRRYSPWNAFRKAHDAERLVIRAGSVIAFKLEPARKPADLSSLARRVGYCQEQGLGLVAVNPAYLFEMPMPNPPLGTDPTPDQPSSDVPPLPAGASLLAKTVHQRYCRTMLQVLAIALGRDWAAEWAGKAQNLSKSQWARLREEAVRATTRDELLRSLDDLKRGLFKHGLSALKWEPPGEKESVASEIRMKLKDDDSLSKELGSVRMPATGPDGEDLVSRLALDACREAAIACARAKRKD